jgi:hypothetical protein
MTGSVKEAGKFLNTWALSNSQKDLERSSGVPRNFVRGGCHQIQLRTEGRENGDLGAVAP